MKMDAYAWRNETSDGYEYKIQVNDIKHGDKSTFTKLFKEWQPFAQGWNIKQNTEIKILIKQFQSENDWVQWAKSCPIRIVELKYRAGKETQIQRSCKTRKKRASNAKA